MSLSSPQGRQLSLFGVEATDPSPADLTGLLAGPGQVVRMGGTARVSVVVDAAWRVHVLVAELAARGLAATWVPTVDAHLGVRTSYARSLAPLGAAWLRGAVKRPPADFRLDGYGLRLWVAAAGTAGPLGFLLRLGPSDEQCWAAVGAALSAIGLPAELVGPRAGRSARAAGQGGDGADWDEEHVPSVSEIDLLRAGGLAGDEEGLTVVGDTREDPAARNGQFSPSLIAGPAYRITGRRRLAKLAELVGERPTAAPPDAWPG